MRNIFILGILSLFLTACSGGGDSGGGGGGAPTVETCQDPNRVGPDLNYSLPCICQSGYTVSENGRTCVANNSTGGSGGSGGTGVTGGTGTTVAPQALAYSPNPWTVLVDTSVFPRSPSVLNCTSGCTYAVTGTTPLPSGLILNASSGVISGLPSTVQSRVVKIRASNSAGFSEFTMTINVVYSAPSGLQVNNLASGNMYRVGQAITPISISYSSSPGSVTSMSISPTLPAGLSLVGSQASGWTIQGTPSASSSIQSYTLTATGPSGSANFSFQLGTGAAPTSFSYNITGHPNCVMDAGTPSCTFTRLQQFPDIPAVFNGDNVQFEVVSGGYFNNLTNKYELPSGISLSNANGKIFTTQYGSFEETTYCGASKVCTMTIRAFNGLGSVTANIKIKVDGFPAPTGFAYSGSPFLFRTVTSIGQIQPVWNNNQLPDCSGQAGCYTVSPSLPQGIQISALSGRLEGSPFKTAIQVPTTYTITANDSRGSIATTISIEIKERLPVFSYTQGGIYVFSKGVDVDTIGSPALLQDLDKLCGGDAIPIDSFSISPALPSGLTLNTGAYSCGVNPSETGGAIIGIPTVISGTRTYTITGCNSGGCTSATINLEVAPEFIKIVTGDRHSCALVREDSSAPAGTGGKVLCWGANDIGQLGYVSDESCTHPTLGNINCQKSGRFVRSSGGVHLSGVSDIVAGKNHTCIKNISQQLFCWGDNSNGQLGLGNFTNQSHPVQISSMTDIAGLAAGGDNTCISARFNMGGVIGLVDAQVYCSSSSTGSFVRKTDPSETGSGSQLFISGQIVMGENHRCAVTSDLSFENDEVNLGDEAYIKCWGDNSLGQLGDGQNSGASSNNPVRVSGVSSPINLVAGGNHTCYVRNTDVANDYRVAFNQVFCWGSNEFGQLASGPSGIGQYKSTPTAISLAANNSIDGLWRPHAISATNKASFFFQYEQGLVGGVLQNAEPLLFTAGSFHIAASPYVGSSSASAISIKNSNGSRFFTQGSMSSGASTKDFSCTRGVLGGLSCWGANHSGQLGSGSSTDAVTPVKFSFQTY
jgi:alpha-tubulin suppressor-like RCC1 family protein